MAVRTAPRSGGFVTGSTATCAPSAKTTSPTAWVSSAFEKSSSMVGTASSRALDGTLRDTSSSASTQSLRSGSRVHQRTDASPTTTAVTTNARATTTSAFRARRTESNVVTAAQTTTGSSTTSSANAHGLATSRCVTSVSSLVGQTSAFARAPKPLRRRSFLPVRGGTDRNVCPTHPQK